MDAGNYFKYSREEFAPDALCEYGAENLSADATRPNPERRALERQRTHARERLTRLLAELGTVVETNEESRRPSVRGLKIASATLRGEVAAADREVQDLTARIRTLPKRVPATGLEGLTKDRKLVSDPLDMVAYQVESDLHRMIAGTYARAQDEGRTLLHTVFRAPGRVPVGAVELTVTIARLSSPHRTEVLRQLCDELNQEPVRFPGSDLRLVLATEPPERDMVRGGHVRRSGVPAGRSRVVRNLPTRDTSPTPTPCCRR